ncbi:TetR/AcrR family transcriptional regulator, partial [Streptomyces sp. NPDC056948]
TMTFPTAKALEERRDAAYEAYIELIGRAKATGRLRADFDPSDLVLVHMANAGVVNAAGDAAPDTWRRVVALFIQSFEAPARGPLPAPPEHDALDQAMRRSGPAALAGPEADRSG